MISLDFYKIGFSNTDKGADFHIPSGVVCNFQICTKNVNYTYGGSTPLNEGKLKAAVEMIISVIGSQRARMFNECIC